MDTELFKCEFCPEELTLELRHHTLSKHPQKTQKEVLFKCSKCLKEYTTRQVLRQHERNVHERPRLQCQVCEKTFLYPCNLRDHMDFVHEKKKVTCKICSQTFTHRKVLSVHMQTKHSKCQVHECKECHMEFPNKISLKGHAKQMHKMKNPDLESSHRSLRRHNRRTI